MFSYFMPGTRLFDLAIWSIFFLKWSLSRAPICNLERAERQPLTLTLTLTGLSCASFVFFFFSPHVRDAVTAEGDEGLLASGGDGGAEKPAGLGGGVRAGGEP